MKSLVQSLGGAIFDKAIKSTLQAVPGRAFKVVRAFRTLQVRNGFRAHFLKTDTVLYILF